MKRIVVFSVCFCLYTLTLFTDTVYAQWGDDTRLTYDGSASKTFFANGWNIAVETTGEIHVVWFDNRDGNDEIYYKRWNGTSWETDVRLTNTSTNSRYPSVTVDKNRRVHVAWEEDMPGPDREEVYYKRSTDGGVSWEADVRLSFDPNSSLFPVVAVDTLNRVHVVWQDNRDGNREIYYKRSTDGGVSWGSERRLTFDINASRMPSLACDGGDNLHLAWQDNRDGNMEIYYKKSSDGGLNWSSDTRLTTATQASFYSSISCDNSGRVHIVWEDQRDGNREIYYKRSTDGGGNWEGDIRLTNDAGGSNRPSCATNNLGWVHVTWYDDRDGNWEIYYKRSTDGGTSFSSDTRLTFNSASSEMSSIAVMSSNRVHIAWQDDRDGNYEVYFKTYVPAVSPSVSVKNSASDVTNNGKKASLLGFSVTNNNPSTLWRPEIEIYKVKVKFTSDGITPLTTAIAQSLFDTLFVLRENPNTYVLGTFQGFYDTVAIAGIPSSSISLDINGVQTINVTDPDSSDARINAGETRDFWICAKIKSSAPTTQNFSATVDGDTTPSGNGGLFLRDSPFDILLQSDATSPVSSQIVNSIVPATPVFGVPVSSSYIYSSPTLSWDGNNIYIGSDDSTVYAVAPSGGTTWSYKTSGQIRTFAFPYSNDTIYVNNLSGDVYKLLRGSSTPLWKRSLGTPLRSSPIVIGSFVHFGADNNSVYKIRRVNGLDTTGFPVTSLSGPFSSTPSVDAYSYVAPTPRMWVGSESGPGDFYSILLADGTILNSMSGVNVTTSPCVDVGSGVAYFGTSGGTLYCRYASNLGKPLWWSDFNAGSGIYSSPFVRNGWNGTSRKGIYFGTEGGKFYKVDTTGTLVWEYPALASGKTIGRIRSSPVVYGGYVYFGCDDGFVYALDDSTGVKRDGWPIQTGAEVRGFTTIDAFSSSQPRLYIGSADRKMYRYDITSKPGPLIPEDGRNAYMERIYNSAGFKGSQR